jgi:HTH-type transcriptional regulator, transcriptional repressor of NAD biosynthesis genes
MSNGTARPKVVRLWNLVARRLGWGVVGNSPSPSPVTGLVSGSGTPDLETRWTYLSPVQRAALTVRVCCVGAESTGKSTLVQALAERHHTASMHEYGRDYTVAKKDAGTNDSWDLHDFLRIAEVQQQMEDAVARNAGPLLFCDTDAMSTDLWCERYLGSRSVRVNQLARSRRYDLFVLCDVDIAWEADEIRLGAESRAAMHQRFLEVLSSERVEPWILVSGEVTERMDRVDAEIARLDLLSPIRMHAAERFLNLDGKPYERGGSQETIAQTRSELDRQT